GRLGFRSKTAVPVVRSKAIAPVRAAATCGTARARASRSESGFVLAELFAAPTGSATATAQAATAIQPRRIDALFGPAPDGSSGMGPGEYEDSPGGPCNTRWAGVIIGLGMTPVAIDFGTLCDELDAIIAGPPARDDAARAHFERTLTDG